MAILGVRRRQTGAAGPDGDPIVTYADETPWEVWGYAPGDQALSEAANRDLQRDPVEILWTVYAYSDDPAKPGPLDRVVLGGEEYDIAGQPGDWSHGGFGRIPGPDLTVKLKRVEG